MDDCEDLIRPALLSALDSFKIERDENSCKVVTPFRHTNGDLIKIWIHRTQGDYFVIRDYGETYAMLRLYGVDPTAASRQERVENIQARFDLESEAGEVKLIAKPNNLSNRIMDGIQAIQALSFLTYLHRSQQPYQFKTEVKVFLEDTGYSIEPDFEVAGTTHTRTFDFGINHRQPNVLLDTIHTNDEYQLRQQVDGVMLNWHEIQNVDYRHGVVVDDVDGIYKQSILKRLMRNLDYFFRWGDKDEIKQKIPVTEQ